LHADTDLAAGVRIEPWVVFGAGVKVAESAHVRSFSYLEGATIGPRSVVGPYARLRPGTVLEADVRVGNFTEIKASFVGLGSKIPHLSYIGDASLGVGVNVGAGVITCNYDGRMKHRTSVGSESFIGSNSALVAPVTLGDRSLIGAGSVITQDVPDDHLALTRVPQTMRGRSAPSLKHKEGKK
jgi:bifunctional UDP-N-acetylglucosamine pyrophosphorylase/glucosamine-1-phosphate N-acetyltransferase